MKYGLGRMLTFSFIVRLFDNCQTLIRKQSNKRSTDDKQDGYCNLRDKW